MSQFSQHVYFCLQVMAYRLFHKVTDAFVTGICHKSHVYRIIIASNRERKQAPSTLIQFWGDGFLQTDTCSSALQPSHLPSTSLLRAYCTPFTSCFPEPGAGSGGKGTTFIVPVWHQALIGDICQFLWPISHFQGDITGHHYLIFPQRR